VTWTHRAALAAIGVVLAVACAAPPASSAAPTVEAEAAIVVDADTGDVLYEEDADDRRAVASTTKLMTALLTLERADLDDTFAAAPYDALPFESKIDLAPGERMTVRDLLTALLLESANDAAVTLAEGISGSESKFVDLMNERAQELGLDGTRYANPIGLDDPDNYSTARDLASLAGRLMGDRRFKDIVRRESATLESGERPRTIENRNRLVSDGLVDGVKTGYTIDAGNVLVGSATREGKRVISVVLGEATEAGRDADSLALLAYGLDRFRRYDVVEADEELASAAVRYRDGERVPLVAAKEVVLTLPRGDRAELETTVAAPPELEGPLPPGARVGSATVLYRGEPVKKIALELGEPVRGPSLTTRFGLALQRRAGWILLGLAAIVGIAVFARSRIRRSRRGRAG
jgi:serine-type D-Ala-D-Ala carboxypeptidase (penicillin-binding protein 5/6)